MPTRSDFAKKRPTKSTSPSGRWKWVAVAAGLLVMCGSTVWGAKYLMAARQMSAVRTASAELFSEETRNLPEAERRAKFESLREQYEALPEAMQQQLREEREQRWEARETQQLTEFFALPPAERKAAIDKEIDREEERRKEWEKRRVERDRERAARGESGGDRGGRNSGGGGGASSAGSGGSSNAPSAERGRGGGGRSGYRDPERRNEWRKKRLDNSTPEGRAMRAEYYRLKAQRRAERGLASSSGRGWGRG